MSFQSILPSASFVDFIVCLNTSEIVFDVSSKISPALLKVLFAPSRHSSGISKFSDARFAFVDHCFILSECNSFRRSFFTSVCAWTSFRKAATFSSSAWISSSSVA